MKAEVRVVALDIPAALKPSISAKDGKELSLEDVFLEWTGKKLVNPDKEENLP